MGKAKINKKNAQSIKSFVDNWFRRYHLENDSSLSDDIMTYSAEALQCASQALGITQDELLACDERAARRWQEKYPFFRLYNRFDACQTIANNHAKPEELFLFAVFDDEAFTPPKKFNGKSIYDRAMTILKDTDQYLPGSYHHGEKAVDFQFATTLFFTFPKINVMLSSFCDMVDRVKELFFRAWDEDLSTDEIREYDFLANFLQLKDRSFARTICYVNLKKLVPIYREEGYRPVNEDFSSLITLKFCKGFTPWACKEFSEYPELAQRYATIYPEAKAKMFDFGKSVKYFACSFRWSDEPEPRTFASEEEEADWLEEEEMKSLEEDWDLLEEDAPLSDESEIEDEEFDLDASLFSEAPMSDGLGLLSSARVLVPKTDEEIDGDDGEAAEKLLRLGGSAKEGGVKVTMPRWIPAQGDAWMARANAFEGC